MTNYNWNKMALVLTVVNSCVLTLMVSAFSVQSTSRTVRASKVELVNDQGKLVGTWSASGDGSSIRLYGSGHLAATLDCTTPSPALVLFSGNPGRIGKKTVFIGSALGMPGFAIYDEKEEIAIQGSVNWFGRHALLVDGKPVVTKSGK